MPTTAEPPPSPDTATGWFVLLELALRRGDVQEARRAIEGLRGLGFIVIAAGVER